MFAFVMILVLAGTASYYVLQRQPSDVSLSIKVPTWRYAGESLTQKQMTAHVKQGDILRPDGSVVTIKEFQYLRHAYLTLDAGPLISKRIKPLGSDWAVDEVKVDKERFLEWMSRGMIRYASGELVEGYIDPERFIEKLTFLTSKGEIVEPYIDYYEVTPGATIVFRRIVFASNVYTVSVSRRFEPVFPTIYEKPQIPDVTYTSIIGLEVTPYSVVVPECLIPGEYAYRPIATYRANIVKTIIQPLPPVRFMVVEPDQPNPNCMESYPYYYGYYTR